MMAEKNKNANAIVLLSGGLDSATMLAYAIHENFNCHALTFLYGQRHDCEIAASKRVAEFFGISDRHRIIELDSRMFSGSSLTGEGAIPSDRDVKNLSEIPSTYVPARNTVFLALSLSMAEQIGARDIFIGANAVDYSGYPDCRPEFIVAFERMANLGTKAGVNGEKISIHVPLIHLSKVEIIQMGLKLGVDYSLTWSCYDPQPNGYACGVCDSCRIRKSAFKSACVCDPIPYLNTH